MNETERAMRLASLLAEESVEPDRWWWLSFADGDLPVGSQFLGVAVVRAPGFVWATMEARRRGINPGGEVQGLPFPDEIEPPARFTNRLLSKAEATACDGEMKDVAS